MLIKIDILSNNGLSQCIEDKDVKIDEFTFDNPEVYKCLEDGDNLGITYAESRGMNKIFTLMKPKSRRYCGCPCAYTTRCRKNGQKFNYLKNFQMVP